MNLLTAVRNHSTAVRMTSLICGVSGIAFSEKALKVALLVVSIVLLALDQLALRLAPKNSPITLRSNKKPPPGFLQGGAKISSITSAVPCEIVVRVMDPSFGKQQPDVELSAKSGDTILRIKQLIQVQKGWSLDCQRLIYSGEQLSDEFAISNELAERGPLTLHLVLRAKSR